MQHRILSLTALCAGWIVGGCGDNASAPALGPLPGAPPIIARIRGTADFVNGTLTFEPMAPASSASAGAPGFSGQIYGVQGTTVRIYNSAVVTTNPSSPGKKTFSANVGVRNLLAFNIGDEQSAVAPPDTMGIFVFVNSGPTVRTTSSSCPSCTVTVKNGHGVLTFNQPLQPYWYWLDRLDAVSGTRDTTLVRKSWVFEADTQVTAFDFDVLVSAAWSAPHEVRWKVDYEGDSLPDSQTEPKWTLYRVGAGTYVNTTPGQLRVSPGAAPNEVNFYRRDSLNTATSAWVEASVKYNGPTIALAGGRLLIDNNVRSVGFGIAANRVGFISATNAFIGTPFTINTTTALHVYQLRKYAADSGVFFVDGTRRGVLPYATFSLTPSPGTAPLVGFGHLGAGTATTDWNYVVYEIGSPFP
jgi:hypothetical protein